MTAAISCSSGATVRKTPAEPGSLRERLPLPLFSSLFLPRFLRYPPLPPLPSGSLNKIQYCESKQMHNFHGLRPWPLPNQIQLLGFLGFFFMVLVVSQGVIIS